MKILIRHPVTKLYRKSDGSWTQTVDEAEVFGGTPDAVKLCIAERLEAYEVLMKHATNSNYDVSLIERRQAVAGDVQGKGCELKSLAI